MPSLYFCPKTAKNGVFQCKRALYQSTDAKGRIIPYPLCITRLKRPFLLLFLMWKHRFTNVACASACPACQAFTLLATFMALNSQDIARIANLARLELQPEESQRMLGQINGFFDIVERMRAVDTAGIEPLSHPVAAIQDISLRLREDVASEPNQREANQRSAPAVERGLFLVPKVIE
jgi:aspartyl-tRNA(Asn)/glutamyl-tRNA(Gln) amidotransferase subunit C